MRHYEIVLLIHPGQSEQVTGMVERYCTMVQSSGGNIHRKEDWGRRMLAYPIKELHKAHYILLNVEIGVEPLKELSNAFRFNDAIIRDLIIKRDFAITDPSVFAKMQAEEPDIATTKNDTPSDVAENNLTTVDTDTGTDTGTDTDTDTDSIDEKSPE